MDFWDNLSSLDFYLSKWENGDSCVQGYYKETLTW